MTSLVPKPFLKPAMDKVMGDLKLELSRSMTRRWMRLLSPPPSGRVSKTYMAHPAEPWPYGTVLRPKYDAPSRVMWIGDRQVMWMGREDGSEATGPATINPEHWEPVPEMDD